MLCYGLRSNFRTLLLQESKRLFELGNSLTKIKPVCKGGCKAKVTACVLNGKLLLHGKQVDMEDNHKYIGMYYGCRLRKKNSAVAALKGEHTV